MALANENRRQWRLFRVAGWRVCQRSDYQILVAGLVLSSE